MKLREKLSQCWSAIQGNLFPWLQEELGPPSAKQQRLITVLEVCRVGEFIPSYKGFVGRPQDNRCAIRPRLHRQGDLQPEYDQALA